MLRLREINIRKRCSIYSHFLIQEDGDYGYSAFELSLSFDSENKDARAGISLLEYAWKKNYSEAIRQGKEALKLDPQYIFKYDNNLDRHDILLNIALSQYSSQLYVDCLDTVKELDTAYDLEITDTEFDVKLLQKLQELVEMYK